MTNQGKSNRLFTNKQSECSTPDNAEEPYRASFSETEKLREASGAAAEKYGVPYFLAKAKRPTERGRR
jgi:hypothetical protein